MYSRVHKRLSDGVAPSEQYNWRIGIAVAQWHVEVTEILYKGAEQFLLQAGIVPKNLIRKNVSGSFELPLAAQQLFQRYRCNGVICLGCIIKGETEHYRYISEAVTQGLIHISLSLQKPIGFGVLTTNNLQQAKQRAGGKFGNKGEEAAQAVIAMLKEFYK